MHRLENYLDRVCHGLNLPDEDLELIREEIHGHLCDVRQGLTEEGLSDEEALTRALEETGAPSLLREHYRSTYMKQHLSRTLSRFIGLALLVGLLCASFFIIDLGMAACLDPHALLLVPGGATLLLLGTFRIRDVAMALAAPFRLTPDAHATKWLTARNVFQTWAVYLLGCGFLAAAMGAHLVFKNMADPALIGPPLSLALLGLIYGALLAGVLWTFAQSLPWIPEPETREKVHPFQAGTTVLGFVTLAASVGSLYAPLSEDALSLSIALFVLAGALALAVATFGFKGTWNLVARSSHSSPKTRACHASNLRTLGIYLGVMGLVGFLNLCLVQLSSLDSMDRLYKGLSHGLLNLVYGLPLGLFCWVWAGPAAGGKRVKGMVLSNEPLSLGNIENL